VTIRSQSTDLATAGSCPRKCTGPADLFAHPPVEGFHLGLAPCSSSWKNPRVVANQRATGRPTRPVLQKPYLSLLPSWSRPVLKQLEKSKGGGKPKSNRSADTTGAPKTLSELGISKDQSATWQKLADARSRLAGGGYAAAIASARADLCACGWCPRKAARATARHLTREARLRLNLSTFWPELSQRTPPSRLISHATDHEPRKRAGRAAPPPVLQRVGVARPFN
jgi:hypothetical protein